MQLRVTLAARLGGRALPNARGHCAYHPYSPRSEQLPPSGSVIVLRFCNGVEQLRSDLRRLGQFRGPTGGGLVGRVFCGHYPPPYNRFSFLCEPVYMPDERNWHG